MCNSMKILFVCKGNTCRSPMAESVMRNLVLKRGIHDWEIDSAGLRSWNVNRFPQHRCINVLSEHGLKSRHKGRELEVADFYKFDYIFVMDESNMKEIRERLPPGCQAKIELLGSYSGKPDSKIITDPYFNETSPLQLAVKLNSTCTFDHDDVTTTSKDFPEGEFTWSKHSEWMLLSSYFYGYMVVQPIAGRLADKFGGKFFLLAGLIGQAFMFVLIPVMARIDYWLAVATRLSQGFLAGFAVPAIYQLYTVWAHPSERASLMSFAYGGYAVGSLSVFPITSFLCQCGWVYVFYVIGGFAVVIGIACSFLIYNTIEAHPWISKKEAFYLEKGRDQTKMVPSIPWKQMFSTVPILTFIVTHICHSYGLIVLNLTLPRFLRDTMHFNMKENGFYSSAIHVGALTSRLIVMLTFSRLYKKSNLSLTVYRRIVYCCGNCFTIFSFLAITALACEHRIFIVVLIFFIGASIDVSFTGAYWVSCIDIAPAFAGLLTGISNSAATLSGILAPHAIASLVTDGTKSEWNYLYYSMAAAYTLSMIVYGCSGSSQKQQWGDFIAEPVKNAKPVDK